ncbi:unnamed protein product [Rotaria sp. Silwood2]|nr:unnamed protein product [Rotaria sp. Silwood2]CAF4298826.1 unnamed protein product [Rotaria sp. Silwood2]
MAESFDIKNSDKTVLYAFRFGTSDKLVHLTQQELNRIPYLFNLVVHKDDFSSAQNENGEYVLNHPIEYTWFMAIFHSITSEQPYTLFDELPEHDYILDVLDLSDYLGIDSFPLPFLKDKTLLLSNSIEIDTTKKHIKYHKATISEARQTAAEFIIALSKNEYDLNDLDTRNNIVFLIEIILSSAAVFKSRFRHHTLKVAKECCYSFFSQQQKRLLLTAQRIAKYQKIESFMYLCNDDKPLPDNFSNTFSWRGVYVLKEDERSDLLSTSSKDTSLYNLFQRIGEIYDWQNIMSSYEIPILSFPRMHFFSARRSYRRRNFRYIYSYEESSINENEENRKKNEAREARSGHFNTLPTRPKVDKFKHQFGLKTQQYR